METETGPWMAINKLDIIPLANGEIQSVNVRWKGKNLVLSKVDGIIALTRVKGKGKNASMAHQTLLLALESDEADLREAGLIALPEVATQKFKTAWLV